MEFGDYIRRVRQMHQQQDRGYSLRQVAGRIRVEPSYLSKVERGLAAPPSRATILRLAAVLQTDADCLLAMADRVAEDLCAAIQARPQLMAKLIRAAKDQPEATVLGWIDSAS